MPKRTRNFQPKLIVKMIRDNFSMKYKSTLYKFLSVAFGCACGVFLSSSAHRIPPISGLYLSDSLPVKDSLIYDSLSEKEKRFPSHALSGVQLAEGLEATLFASEPTISNPTTIDVDHRGRVWVCDAYKFRPTIHGYSQTRTKKDRLTGDRILILEDTDGDGVADLTKVFYEGPELDAPLGIWVMGNKAIVSQSPYVWLFTDDDGDDKADRKEIIFRGISGASHDHGVHSFVFGPDGKFYFNFGSEGKQLLDARGRGFYDKFDQPINFRNYRNGMVFRCDQNFQNLEVLGDNFRNGLEVAVDSYGTVWQSDHDEDGNEGVRINYVMENGNFGYTDEMDGTSWRVNRTNLEEDIASRHWHQNDPGVVPDLLHTGSGAPAGMVVYEGRLLPRKFWDQIIHCDAGPGVVRAYPIQNDGAGYKASMLPLMEAGKDSWFRPSDVCVAPDGSLIVSDWYDPGEGELELTDQNRGRIYRIAPPKTPYKTPTFDLTSPEEAVLALQSPNLSMRYLAWNALVRMSFKAEPALSKLLHQYNADPRMRARALWVLNNIEGASAMHLENSFRNMNPNLRITALRAVRQRNSDPTEYIKRLTADPDPQVRRECALAIYRNHTYEALDVWLQLAQQYEGNDRWYLEALGIGAEGQWNRVYKAWLERVNDPLAKPAYRDIVWRARTRLSIPHLAELASQPQVPLQERLRYFRGFDFAPQGYDRSMALLGISQKPLPDRIEVSKLALYHLGKDFIRDSYWGKIALVKLLDDTYGTQDYLELVARYTPVFENDRLFKLATDQPNTDLGRDAGRQLLRQAPNSFVWDKLGKSNDDVQLALVSAIKAVGSQKSLTILASIAAGTTFPMHVRIRAARSLGGSWEGEDFVLSLLKENRLWGEVRAAAVDGISQAYRKEIRDKADQYLDFSGNNPTSKVFE
ncbi:PVC-type heme-binding CxxCH protein [Arundinibacter roseus]|nr:PVC-type heme-binding CxxCH protein [Arundinibacter roseus]